MTTETNNAQEVVDAIQKAADQLNVNAPKVIFVDPYGHRFLIESVCCSMNRRHTEYVVMLNGSSENDHEGRL